LVKVVMDMKGQKGTSMINLSVLLRLFEHLDNLVALVALSAANSAVVMEAYLPYIHTLCLLKVGPGSVNNGNRWELDT
jgi:hypothetical protein